MRDIAYDGQEAVGWDVEMAYFTSHAVGTLRIKIASTYFRLDTTKAYIADKKIACGSVQEKVSFHIPAASAYSANPPTAPQLTVSYEPTDLYDE